MFTVTVFFTTSFFTTCKLMIDKTGVTKPTKRKGFLNHLFFLSVYIMHILIEVPPLQICKFVLYNIYIYIYIYVYMCMYMYMYISPFREQNDTCAVNRTCERFCACRSQEQLNFFQNLLYLYKRKKFNI